MRNIETILPFKSKLSGKVQRLMSYMDVSSNLFVEKFVKPKSCLDVSQTAYYVQCAAS